MGRVLIIEDNDDLAFGLRNNLEIEGYEVRTAATGLDGLEIAKEWRPDVAILDLMLPGIDGFEVLRRLRKHDQATRVLILSAKGEELDKVRGLRGGADDYLTKPFALMELLARVEALFRRSAPAADAPTIAWGNIEVDPGSRIVRRAGHNVDLTPKELDLLLELHRNKGVVVSRLELLRRVWGHTSAVVTRTVDTHIAELRRKLESDPARPEMIVTVRKAGYRLEHDDGQP